MNNYKYKLIYIDYTGKYVTKYFKTLEGVFNHIKRLQIFSYDLTDTKILKELEYALFINVL